MDSLAKHTHEKHRRISRSFAPEGYRETDIRLQTHAAGHLRKESDAEEVRLCESRRHVLRPARLMAKTVSEIEGRRRKEVD
jgi:hypothetical protein